MRIPGFPIRTSLDHRVLARSPRLFAGSYVLHRLLLPRHPPCALSSYSPESSLAFAMHSQVNPQQTLETMRSVSLAFNTQHQHSVYHHPYAKFQKNRRRFSGWRRRESNPRPSACKADALPTELRPLMNLHDHCRSRLLSSGHGGPGLI